MPSTQRTPAQDRGIFFVIQPDFFVCSVQTTWSYCINSHELNHTLSFHCFSIALSNYVLVAAVKRATCRRSTPKAHHGLQSKYHKTAVIDRSLLVAWHWEAGMIHWDVVQSRVVRLLKSFTVPKLSFACGTAQYLRGERAPRHELCRIAQAYFALKKSIVLQYDLNGVHRPAYTGVPTWSRLWAYVVPRSDTFAVKKYARFSGF